MSAECPGEAGLRLHSTAFRGLGQAGDRHGDLPRNRRQGPPLCRPMPPCPHASPLRIYCTAVTRHYVRDVGDIQDFAEKIMDRCGARPQTRLRTVMGRAVRGAVRRG